MNSDRIKGTLKKRTGQLKEATGTIFGDERLRLKGKAQKTAGIVQNAVGRAKDVLRGK
jgi:uncharacterized protein YjbJ (UPF0337 family)